MRECWTWTTKVLGEMTAPCEFNWLLREAGKRFVIAYLSESVALAKSPRRKKLTVLSTTSSATSLLNDFVFFTCWRHTKSCDRSTATTSATIHSLFLISLTQRTYNIAAVSHANRRHMFINCYLLTDHSVCVSACAWYSRKFMRTHNFSTPCST